MSAEAPPPPGDRALVSVLVKLPPSEAFRVFTEEIDAWWRGGLKYRIGKQRSVVHLEPKLGGRLFESFETGSRGHVKQTGVVTCWEPPSRLVLEWRAVNFAPAEKTEVEVLFEPSASGTLVSVRHSGWSRIRPDHPVRHGQEAQAFIRSMGLWWGELMSSLREHAARAAGERAGD
jgi:uncharacterized protein YndB with AHSA1/START domain